MRVFLIHGMGRTPASMWILDRRLRGVGYRPSLFGYFVTVTNLDDIVDRFAAHIERVLAADRAAGTGSAGTGSAGTGEAGYAIVSHSLGGLITRLADSKLPAGLQCCVMLAPPNHPPAMARTLKDNAIYRLVTQDTGRKVSDPAFFESLPVPAAPVFVVAGTGGPRAPWLPFRGEPNDSILRLEETHLEGAPSLVVDGLHSFLMNRRDVFDAIHKFFVDQSLFGCHRVC